MGALVAHDELCDAADKQERKAVMMVMKLQLQMQFKLNRFPRPYRVSTRQEATLRLQASKRLPLQRLVVSTCWASTAFCLPS
jgi:hypothetical protein